uniref:Putative secreted protein n=1 Tax=Panstrongylus lignarius TaxID=156445 RepID=A0A224XY05_9HEMI
MSFSLRLSFLLISLIILLLSSPNLLAQPPQSPHKHPPTTFCTLSTYLTLLYVAHSAISLSSSHPIYPPKLQLHRLLPPHTYPRKFSSKPHTLHFFFQPSS